MNLDFQVISKFKPLFDGSLGDKRLLIYYGGRGGGKTDQITLFLLLKAISEKNITILIGREYEKSNIQSLTANFRLWINQLGLKDYFISDKLPLFKLQLQTITCNLTNTRIIFTGINENVIFGLKSIPNIKYCWIDEANYLSEKTYRILTPTIRADKSQIILTLNPQNESDFVWGELIAKNKDDKFKYICKVNYSDNKYFPSVLELERKRDFKTLPRDLYLHIWEGEPTNYNDMQVIDTSKFGRFDDTNKLKGKYDKIVLVIDSAFSTKASADYSVVSCWGRISDEIHLFRLERGHWDFHTLLEMLKSLYFWTNENYGNVSQIIIEKKASGQSLIQEIHRLTTLEVYPVIPTTDKFTRLTEIISDIDKIKLPISDNVLNYWINDFLSECKAFRADLKHEHDDMVDCMIYALNELRINKVDWEKLANLAFKTI